MASGSSIRARIAAKVGRAGALALSLLITLAVTAIPVAVQWPPGLPVYAFAAVGAVVCAAVFGFRPGLVATFGGFTAATALALIGHLPSAELVARAALTLIVCAAVLILVRGVERREARAAQYELRLARKQALLNAILTTLPDAMIVIDDKGVISDFSTAAEQMFGWRAEDVVGRNVSVLMPPPYRAEHDGYMSHYLVTGERRVIGKRREIVGLRRDGSEFPMALHVGEAWWNNERHFTGFIVDLTELNAANIRTQELRSQLTHIWRLNSLGEMAAVLAHELNQPLAAIANYTRGARSLILRHELKDDALIEAIDQASQQAVRAGDIIRRMRTMLARPTADRSPESLSDLIHEMEPMLALMVREANVRLEFDLSDEPDEVLVDRLQIQQVLGNLVRNAVEALVDWPRRLISVSTSRDQDQWLICIEDSGPGFTPEVAAHLFTPLNSTKSGGMGLGLSICRSIVEAHEGAISADRSRFGGAAICVKLQTMQKMLTEPIRDALGT